MKVKMTLSIEKKVLENAKKQIPNLSAFVEECLIQYLGYVDGLYPTAKASDLIETISKTQAELFILTESNKVSENIVRIENEKQNRIWRLLWNDYRRRLTLNPNMTREAVELLDVDEEILEDVMDWLLDTDVFVDSESWKNVYEKYMEMNKND